MTIGQQGWTSEPLRQMEWFLPDVNDVECCFGTVEPTPDKILDSIFSLKDGLIDESTDFGNLLTAE
jgi:hypothetical protein